jgi:hypothetical protein
VSRYSTASSRRDGEAERYGLSGLQQAPYGLREKVEGAVAGDVTCPAAAQSRVRIVRGDHWSRAILGCVCGIDPGNSKFWMYKVHVRHINLMQATNIKKICLTSDIHDPLFNCCQIIGLSWRFYKSNLTDCPFNKLEELCIHCPRERMGGSQGFGITIPHSVRILRLLSLDVGIELAIVDTFPLTLSNLGLTDTVTAPTVLVQALGTGKFQHLRRLCLDRIRGSSREKC